MLIACSGPDTWQARAKARALVQAFRDKHDTNGYSTEVLVEPTLEAVLQQLGSPSLFAKKRCIRCDGILGSLKIADIRLLAKRIVDDGDQTILISVEEEPITEKIKEAFVDKGLVIYPFPTMTGDAFFRWCMEYAQDRIAVEKVKYIAQIFAGDTWKAVQELDKCFANPTAEMSLPLDEDAEIFAAAESFVRGRTWREQAERLETEAFFATSLSQVRAALRVRDGAVKGLHPFVVKKLTGLRQASLEKKFRSLVRAQQLNRSGVGNADDVISLLF